MDTRTIQGRQVGAEDIELIRRLIADNPSLSRTRLSQELCRLWDWRTPTGQLKDMAARSLLRKLASAGEIALPRQRNRGGGELWAGAASADVHQFALFSQDPAPPRIASLAEVRPLRIVVAETSDHLALFTALLREHHYLGLSRRVGLNLKYLVYDRQDRVLACLLFGSSAWRCAARDRFIGWNDAIRAQRLNWVTNNSRFLILGRIPHLASHVLGTIMRRLRSDWQAKYAQPLVLVETFVDQTRFAGTCYQAANWIRVGQTQGRTRNDRHNTVRVPTKAVYVYPLVPHFREVLTQ